MNNMGDIVGLDTAVDPRELIQAVVGGKNNMAECLKVFHLGIEGALAGDDTTKEVKRREAIEHIQECESCERFVRQLADAAKG
jgi:hypothetical protein